MATTDNMLLDLPDVGTTPVASAAAKLVDALETVDTHDHSEGKGAQVTCAGININADLEMNGHELTEVGAVEMVSNAEAIAGASNANKINAVNGELYFTDGNGLPVRITSNGGLDVTVSGGWSGDYSSTDAEGTYISATSTFKLMQDATTNQAGILDVGDIKLRTTTAGESSYVTIKSPDPASNYDLTLFEAPPGSGSSLVTLDSTGQLDTTETPAVQTLTATNSVTTPALTVSNLSTLDDLTVNGAADFNNPVTFNDESTFTGAVVGPVTVSGVITADSGIVVTEGENITLSGDGQLKHGNETLSIPCFMGAHTETTPAVFSALGYASLPAGERFFLPIPLRSGDNINNIEVSVWNDSPGTIAVNMYGINASGNRTLPLMSELSSSSTGWLILEQDINVTISASSVAYWVEVYQPSTTYRVAFLTVRYTRP